MENTADFLDALRVKLNLPSDGQLADHLGAHRQHISRYRTLGHTFDDSMSLRVAEILELDPAYVMACMHHQRAKEKEVKQVWESLAKRLSAVAAALAVLAFAPAIILSVQGFLPSPDNLAWAGFALPSVGNTVYYVKSIIAMYWWVFLLLFAALLPAFPRHTRRKK